MSPQARPRAQATFIIRKLPAYFLGLDRVRFAVTLLPVAFFDEGAFAIIRLTRVFLVVLPFDALSLAAACCRGLAEDPRRRSGRGDKSGESVLLSLLPCSRIC